MNTLWLSDSVVRLNSGSAWLIHLRSPWSRGSDKSFTTGAFELVNQYGAMGGNPGSNAAANRWHVAFGSIS